MNYRAFVKQQLMGGKMHRSRGFGLVNGLGLHNRISRNYRSGGTISSRPYKSHDLPDFAESR